MHQDILVLVEADNFEDAIKNAHSEIDSNITRIGNYYSEKYIEVVRADDERFWSLFKKHMLYQYDEIRHFFKYAREAEEYASKIFYKAQAYRALCGWQFQGSWIINGVNQSSTISFLDRCVIKDDPESYYIVIYNYHN